MNKLWKYTSWRPFDTGCERDINCALVSRCYSRDNLLNSQLYFNSPKAFNDPFDTAPFLATDATKDQVIETAIRAIEIYEGLNGEEALRRAKKLIRKFNLNNEDSRKEAVREVLASLRETGVCCFTKAGYDNILFWSHYAEKHTGICLEFYVSSTVDLIISPRNSKRYQIMQPTPVVYDFSMPKLNLFTNMDDTLYKCHTTKSPDWKHEVEYRALCLNYVGLLPYDPRLLSAVIAGCKMPDKEFEELVKTVDKLQYQPRLYRTKKKERDYGFDLVRII